MGQDRPPGGRFWLVFKAFWLFGTAFEALETPDSYGARRNTALISIQACRDQRTARNESTHGLFDALCASRSVVSEQKPI